MARRRLSRLDEDLFAKDTRYACTYWLEHADNFAEMVYFLLTEESLCKFIENAFNIALQFNEKSNMVPKELNETLIKTGYEKIIEIVKTSKEPIDLTEFRGFSTNAVAVTKGKRFIIDGMSNFYLILFNSRDKRGISFSDIFSEEEAVVTLTPFLSAIFDEVNDTILKTFVPQLFTFFFRILSLYDNAMQGQHVVSYFEQFSNEKATLLNEKKVKTMWDNSLSDNQNESQNESSSQSSQSFSSFSSAPQSATSPSNLSFTREKIIEELGEDASEDQIKKVLQQKAAKVAYEQERIRTGKSEVWALEDAIKAMKEIFDSLVDNELENFEKRWSLLSIQDRKDVLSQSRSTLLSIANSSFQSSLLYCPELNSAELAKEETSFYYSSPHYIAQATSSSDKSLPVIKSFLELVKICQNFPSLPTVKDNEITDEFIEKFEENDIFLKRILEKLKSINQEKNLPLIALSRRNALLVFINVVLSLVLQKDIYKIISLLPGYQDQQDDLADSVINEVLVNKTSKPPTRPPPPPKYEIRGKKPEQFKEKEEKINIVEITDNNNNNNNNEILGRKCSREGCENLETIKKFQVCSFCKRGGISIPYCSRDCQVDDWKSNHKNSCLKNQS